MARSFSKICDYCALSKHRLAAANGNSTALSVEFTIVYVCSTNGFIKTCIERAAEGGMAKNFAQILEFLGKQEKVTVEDAESGRSAANAALQQVSRPLSEADSTTRQRTRHQS